MWEPLQLREHLFTWLQTVDFRCRPWAKYQGIGKLRGLEPALSAGVLSFAADGHL